MSDREPETIFSEVVELKCRGDDEAAPCVIDNIAKLGYKRALLNTDQEPSLEDLVKCVIEVRYEPTTPQWSPLGEPQSNGSIERGSQSVEDQVRTCKLAPQQRLGGRIPSSHNIMSWMVPHCSDTLKKLQAVERRQDRT